MKLSLLGEEKVVRKILEEFVDSVHGSSLSKYDDAIAYPVGDVWVLVNIDGTSAKASKYPWQSWDSFGYRVACSATADIIAKGGKPVLIAASLGVPKSWEADLLMNLIRGIKNLSKSINALYCGGDLNSSGSNEAWIDVAVIGVAHKVVPNTPLKVGDKAYVSKCLGISAIPYIVYSKKLDYRVWEDVLSKAMYPHPPIEFLDVIKKYTVTASTDISDGMGSILRVLNLNNVGLKVKELPLCDEVIEFMRE
ncbi:MAG: hypothetical protein J7J20_04650, partial [Desulfurococcales archaeon]|nr:hypothetical protein [Desulfurococcales archaeon]